MPPASDKDLLRISQISRRTPQGSCQYPPDNSHDFPQGSQRQSPKNASRTWPRPPQDFLHVAPQRTPCRLNPSHCTRASDIEAALGHTQPPRPENRPPFKDMCGGGAAAADGLGGWASGLGWAVVGWGGSLPKHSPRRISIHAAIPQGTCQDPPGHWHNPPQDFARISRSFANRSTTLRANCITFPRPPQGLRPRMPPLDLTKTPTVFVDFLKNSPRKCHEPSGDLHASP